MADPDPGDRGKGMASGSGAGSGGKGRMDRAWKNLEQVVAWKRENMGFLSLPQGADVLAWLLRDGGVPRPLDGLSRAGKLSEPAVRGVLESMIEDGLVVIRPGAENAEAPAVAPTGKLLALVDEYRRRLRATRSLLA